MRDYYANPKGHNQMTNKEIAKQRKQLTSNIKRLEAELVSAKVDLTKFDIDHFFDYDYCRAEK